MRIAIWHNLPNGGGKRALYYHVKGLLERGHTVECWCPPSAHQAYLPLSDLTVEHTRPLAWPQIPPRPLSSTLADARVTVRRLEALSRHAQLCAEEIQRREFDVVLANSCQSFRVPAIARHLGSVPTVLYLGEPYRALYEALPQLPWAALPDGGRWPLSPREITRRTMDYVRVRSLRIQVREELASARSFGSVLVNSYFSRESVLRAYGIEGKVCYLGVDTTLFRDYGTPREGFVVGVGSFTPEKRIEFVIKALSHVSPRHRRLVWIGNIAVPQYLAELHALATALDVTFEPRLRISDADIVRVLNQASVMAYAPRLEPFGFAPLEANACGTPVCAVAEGGVRETVLSGVNGVLCEPEPEAMAVDLQRLLDNPHYARSLGAAARELVLARWSLAAAVDRLEDRLHETVDRAHKSE